MYITYMHITYVYTYTYACVPVCVNQCVAVCCSMWEIGEMRLAHDRNRTDVDRRSPLKSQNLNHQPHAFPISDQTLSVLQCVAVCCSVLQCVAVCCSVLQCVAVCCSVVLCVLCFAMCYTVLQYTCIPEHVCCSVLQYVAAYRSVLQCVAVCYTVLQ